MINTPLPPEQALALLSKVNLATELDSRRKDTPKRGRFPVPKQDEFFVVNGVVLGYHSHNDRSLTMKIHKQMTRDYFGIVPDEEKIEKTQNDVEIHGWNFRISRVWKGKILLRPVGLYEQVGISQ